jgi:hypothetical protein
VGTRQDQNTFPKSQLSQGSNNNRKRNRELKRLQLKKMGKRLMYLNQVNSNPSKLALLLSKRRRHLLRKRQFSNLSLTSPWLRLPSEEYLKRNLSKLRRFYLTGKT